VKRTIIIATGTFILPSVERLIAARAIEVVAVVTQPARPVGRDQHLQQTPAAIWAQERGFKLLEVASLRAHVAELLAFKPECVLVGDVGLFIPNELLVALPDNVLNLHGSLLPKYRGASPIPQAILDGCTETGVTWMQVVQAIDAGDMIVKHAVPITPTDTTPTLYEKLSQCAADSVVHDLQAYWDGSVLAQPQDASAVTHTKKITRDDGRATWHSAALEERKIRAYTPWPGVWTTIDGQRLKLLGGSVVETSESATPGTIIPYNSTWAIACQDGVFLPTLVQREGKKPEPPENTLQAVPTLLGSRCV
jgi:methionyl-tRNA formyltransferase